MNLLSVLLFLLLNYTYLLRNILLLSLGSMACTKQTHRNPNLERPTAAMGSDVQPE